MKDMIFMDGRREEFWSRVFKQLELWKDLDVLDVACGFGKFSGPFSKYLGMDFSTEMLKKAAELHPAKDFVLADFKQTALNKTWDVIFEVNSLKSLGLKQEEFMEIATPHTRKFVACLEADSFTIKNVYAN